MVVFCVKDFNFQTEQIPFEQSAAGKQMQELQKLRKNFDNYVKKQEAERIADQKRREAERKCGLFVSIFSGAIAGIISGVFLLYWPTIIAWASSLIH